MYMDIETCKQAIEAGRVSLQMMFATFDDNDLLKLSVRTALDGISAHAKTRSAEPGTAPLDVLTCTALMVAIDTELLRRVEPATATPGPEWRNERPSVDGLYLRSNPPLPEIVMLGIMQIGTQLVYTDPNGELQDVSTLSPRSWWFGPISQPLWKSL